MKITVGTFNLFQFVEPPYAWYTRKDKFNLTQWSHKTRWIKKQIIKMDCDIIGFQEVFSQNALKNLVQELGFNYFETVDVPKVHTNNKNIYVSMTVAIASKYPISKLEAVHLHTSSLEKHHFKGVFSFSRTPIKATITLPNKKDLLVYVCHLKSNRLNEFEYVFTKNDSIEEKKTLVSQVLEMDSFEALKQRLCEASSLFFDMQKSKNKPIVLLCDLNDKEFSLTIDVLSNPKYYNSKSVEESLLYDASYQYIPPNPHPEKKEVERKSTSYFLGKGNVLDYIFISKDIAKVTNYAVLDKHLENNKEGSLLTSDHAQVVCELTL